MTRETAHWSVAYIAVGLSAGLAAWSGVRASDGYVDATLKGLVMFVIAMLGCHGWAWAARLAKDGHKSWGVASYAILSVAMLVTLLGGAGSFYGAATKKMATAERGTDAYVRADTAIKALATKQNALTKHRSKGEVTPDITAAEGDAKYKSSKSCTPGKITLEETLTFCIGYRALETELAAAVEDERLEALKQPYETVVGKGRPSQDGGPGAIIVAIAAWMFITLDQAQGNALFSILCSFALDMGAVIALLTAELRSTSEPAIRSEKVPTKAKPVDTKPVPEPAPRTEPETITLKMGPPPRPTLAASRQEPPAGPIYRIMVEALEPATGQRVELGQGYLRYAAECNAEGRQPVTPDQYQDAMVGFCKAGKIKTKIEGGKLYLLDVQLSERQASACVERLSVRDSSA